MSINSALMKLMCKLILVLIVGVVMSNCGQKKQEVLQPEEFPVMQVFNKDLQIPLEYVANIQAIQNVEIRARVEGYLEDIFVDEGKTVAAGQMLFKINDEEYRAAIDRAKANVADAEAEARTATVELERVKLLVNKNIVAKTELDLADAKLEMARSRIKVAKAEVATAEIKLAHTNIRSPFAGVIDRLPIKKGSLISEGSLITNISDISQVYAYFNVSEVEFLQFVKKDTRSDTAFLNNVQLFLADGTIYPLKGRIDAIQSQFKEGTGAISVRAKFANSNGILKHGSTGKVRLHEIAGKALLIPQKSALEIQDKNYVLHLDKNNVVQMKSFVPLRRFGDYYIISTGLNEGDTILYEGIQNVREGMVIRPKIVSTAELLKTNSLIQD